MKQMQILEDSNSENYIREIESNGFSVIQDALDILTVDTLIEEIENAKVGGLDHHRSGMVFGMRNLLNAVPAARKLAESFAIKTLIEPVLGNSAKVVRGIYFDKHKDANWKVAWHQDLTIAVRQQANIDGYGPWTIKAGIPHVQPPAAVLENMLTIRLHLDHTDGSTGALRVLPGSHRNGRFTAEDIQSWRERVGTVTCTMEKGGAMLMRPLLLHASSAATIPSHRRVLHFEYSALDLPYGLEWFDA